MNKFKHGKNINNNYDLKLIDLRLAEIISIYIWRESFYFINKIKHFVLSYLLMLHMSLRFTLLNIYWLKMWDYLFVQWRTYLVYFRFQKISDDLFIEIGAKFNWKIK